MPYITEESKRRLKDPEESYRSAGDLTYGLYKAAIEDPSTTDFTFGTIRAHIDRFMLDPEFERGCYEDYAIVLGCLSSCAKELDRQQHKHLQSEVIDYIDLLDAYAHVYYAEVIAPYEDTKIEQNGDVTP